MIRAGPGPRLIKASKICYQEQGDLELRMGGVAERRPVLLGVVLIALLPFLGLAIERPRITFQKHISNDDQIVTDKWGYFGTSGSFSRENNPSSRGGSVVFIISNSLWLFGGIGVDDSHLGDLWEFNLDTEEWRWINTCDSETLQQTHRGFGAEHGESMVFRENVYPGSRGYCKGFVSQHSSTSFIIMLGEGRDMSSEGDGVLSDIFEFSTEKFQWRWVNNEEMWHDVTKYLNVLPQDITNHPGGRTQSIGIDYSDLGQDGNVFFIYGGDVYDSQKYEKMDDLWVFNEVDVSFKHLSGSTTPIAQNTLNRGNGSFSEDVNPGQRVGGIGWSHGINLFIFGGSDNNNGKRGDIFSYHLEKDMWRWVISTNSEVETTVGYDSSFDDTYSGNGYPSARGMACGFQLKNRNKQYNTSFFVYAGSFKHNYQTSGSADLFEWSLELEKWRWVPVSESDETIPNSHADYSNSNTSFPGARYDFVVSAAKRVVERGDEVEESYYFFGSLCTVCDPAFLPADLWSFKISYPQNYTDYSIVILFIVLGIIFSILSVVICIALIFFVQWRVFKARRRNFHVEISNQKDEDQEIYGGSGTIGRGSSSLNDDDGLFEFETKKKKNLVYFNSDSESRKLFYGNYQGGSNDDDYASL